MFHQIIMRDMCSFQMNRNRELPCLQAGKGFPERERAQKAHAKKVFEIHALLR
jgi:hypothetical protein